LSIEGVIIEGTYRRKVQFYILVLLLIVLVIISQSDWYAQLFVVDTSNFTDEQLNLYIIEQSNNSIIYSILFLIFNLGMGILCYQFGRRIHISKQFPPPGSEYPFSMKVNKGKKAQLQAYASYLAAVLFVANGLIILGFSIYSASMMREVANAF
jgi:hypothetical protein